MEEIKQNIRVIRYIRPGKKYWTKYWDTDIYSNMYGITLVFNLDFENKFVTVKWSVCNGDNFSKKIGIETAERSKTMLIFGFDEIHGGLVNTVFNKIYNHNFNAHVSNFYYEQIHEIFKNFRIPNIN